MNQPEVILLSLILATLLLGAEAVGRLFTITAGAVVMYCFFMAATQGGTAEWFHVAIALVFIAAYGFFFSYLIWSGLKWIWTRLNRGQDNG